MESVAILSGIKNWGLKHTIFKGGRLTKQEGLLCQDGTSLRKMTLNIITFSITTIRIMALSTTAFNIWILVSKTKNSWFGFSPTVCKLKMLH